MNYRVEALIGEGSAAKVYRAQHVFLNQTYALKVLSTSIEQSPGLEARFKREARALSYMSHPNIVSFVDYGFTPFIARPFFAMEYVAGKTLAEVLSGGSLPIDRVLRIVRQIADGLAEAHRHDIIHRDLKPTNVMLVGEDDQVKILDFGIARIQADETEDLTMAEVVLGTPRYMAPEQVVSPSDASPESDLYSLGVMIYEMLTGSVPFRGPVVQVLEKQIQAKPRALSTNTGLEGLVHRLLAKEPCDRPGDAESVAFVLDRLRRDRAFDVATTAPDRHSRVVSARSLSPVPDTAVIRRQRQRWELRNPPPTREVSDIRRHDSTPGPTDRRGESKVHPLQCMGTPKVSFEGPPELSEPELRVLEELTETVAGLPEPDQPLSPDLGPPPKNPVILKPNLKAEQVPVPSRPRPPLPAALDRTLSPEQAGQQRPAEDSLIDIGAVKWEDEVDLTQQGASSTLPVAKEGRSVVESEPSKSDWTSHNEDDTKKTLFLSRQKFEVPPALPPAPKHSPDQDQTDARRRDYDRPSLLLGLLAFLLGFAVLLATLYQSQDYSSVIIAEPIVESVSGSR